VRHEAGNEDFSASEAKTSLRAKRSKSLPVKSGGFFLAKTRINFGNR